LTRDLPDMSVDARRSFAERIGVADLIDPEANPSSLPDPVLLVKADRIPVVLQPPILGCDQDGIPLLNGISAAQFVGDVVRPPEDEFNAIVRWAVLTWSSGVDRPIPESSHPLVWLV